MQSVSSNAVAQFVSSKFSSYFLTVGSAGGSTRYIQIGLRNYQKQQGQSVLVLFNYYSMWGVIRENNQCYYRGTAYSLTGVSWTSYTVDNNNYFWLRISGYYTLQLFATKEMWIMQNTSTAPSGVTFTGPVAWT